MSKKSAKDFIDRVEKDQAFRSELLKAKSNEERQKMVTRNKFSFTEKEYKEAYQEKYHTPVNEEELRKVVGGTARGGKTSNNLSNMNPEVAKLNLVGRFAMLED
jgi:predicted ribosomally synthesized peptide with nif11-like leader